MSYKRIYLACDHAGYSLKEEIKKWLLSKPETLPEEYQIIDLGADSMKSGDSYVPYMEKAAESVQKDTMHDPSFAILFGGSGTGEAIVANRYAHIRAFVWNGNPFETVKLARDHNDANVLSVGARFVTLDETMVVVAMFLATPFGHEERHSDRIISIDADSEYLDD